MNDKHSSQPSDLASLQEKLAFANSRATIAESVAASQREQLATNKIALERASTEVRAQQLWMMQLESMANNGNRGLLLLRSIAQSRGYRLIRKLGGWQWIENEIKSVLSASKLAAPLEFVAVFPPRKAAFRIAVDCTPLVAGGENGGIKVWALELVQLIVKNNPDWEIILLTSDRCHDELMELRSDRLTPVCVFKAAAGFASRAQFDFQGNHESVAVPTPQALLDFVCADSLFSPFTSPTFYDARTPVLTVIADLQCFYYAYFFEEPDLVARKMNAYHAAEKSAILVCISNFVRGTVLENMNVSPAKVKAIHINLPQRLSTSSEGATSDILNKLALKKDGYLLYPANYWVHKNHRMLFVAYALFRSRHPGVDFKLVCTGAPDKRFESVKALATGMKLEGSVIFPGYVAKNDLSVLMNNCRAVIFPSLYEGFGMPVLEAMALSKPVVCSNVCSLPEVAGDAALLFDPRNPENIADAIARIYRDDELVRKLSSAGAARVAQFNASEMVEQYLQLMKSVLDTRGAIIQGLFRDGWASRQLFAIFPPKPEARSIHLQANVPAWVPHASITVQCDSGGDSLREYTLKRGEVASIVHPVPPSSRHVRISVNPVFIPAASNIAPDTRELGFLLESANIRGESGPMLHLTQVVN